MLEWKVDMNMKQLKEVRHLPEYTNMNFMGFQDSGARWKPMVERLFKDEHGDWMEERLKWARSDVGITKWGAGGIQWPSTEFLAWVKCKMILDARVLFSRVGVAMDKYNGLDSSDPFNEYKAYEFSALWIWIEMIWHSQCPLYRFDERWFKKFGPVLKSVAKKYPRYTAVAISLVAGNEISSGKKLRSKFLDCSELQNEYDGLSIKF